MKKTALLLFLQTAKLLIFLSFFLFLNSLVSDVHAAGITANPIISRIVPAYTSDDCAGTKPASLANDADYTTYWRSCNANPSISVPVTLTYDLSAISAASRGNVILAWYNDIVTGAYNHILISTNGYNIPKDYTIQANAGAGGGSVPSSGWVTLVTVTGNTYHSRQHAVNLTGYNWVRMSVTASDGSVSNFDVALNMDVHDTSAGAIDDWIFLGDSITQQAFIHTSAYGNTFSQQINAFNSTYFPIYESGGLGGFTAADGVTNINTWLPLFPGKFVTLNYGTNDANGLISGTTFYNNMKTLVQAVINAGKIPIVPKIPWGCTANITSDVTILNAQIDQLYIDFPTLIKGPDLYSFFNVHQSDISNDCIHPTDPAGYTDYLTLWVNSMKTAVYTLPVVSASPAGGTVSTTQSVTLTSTKAGTIYYTTDGSTPTTSSTIYSSAIAVASTTTVKAMTVDQAGNSSSVISQTYTFPISTPTSSTNTSSNSSSSNTTNQNIHIGWSREIMAGPQYIGTSHFINGEGNAMTFVANNASHNDLFINIFLRKPEELLKINKQTKYPWMQGLNTASEIYDFQALAAFNGYPIQTFDSPVTIILPYDQSRLYGISPNNLTIAMYNKKINHWQIISNAIVNLQNHTLASTTTEFSYFAVVYPQQSPLLLTVPSKNNLLDNKTNMQSSALTPAQPIKNTVLKEKVPVLTNSIPQKHCFLFVCF